MCRSRLLAEQFRVGVSNQLGRGDTEQTLHGWIDQQVSPGRVLDEDRVVRAIEDGAEAAVGLERRTITYAFPSAPD